MERTDQELVRIEKANRIREMGMDPFGHRFDRTHSSEDIREQYSKYEHDELENLEDKVTIAGRIMLERWERPLSLVFKIRLVRCKYIFLLMM